MPTLGNFSASVLLQDTNYILSAAAKYTNKFVNLSAPKKAVKPKLPLEISEASNEKAAAHKKLLAAIDDTQKKVATVEFKCAKANYQKVVRNLKVQEELEHYTNFDQILSKNPAKIFNSIKSRKQSQAHKIKSLKVDMKTYTEENVADGFFDSISQLKTRDSITSPSFESFAADHKHIVEICKSAEKIPPISTDAAKSLLKKIKLSVSDFYSISAAHYINGEDAAISHFCFLFNTILLNIELAGLPELNTVHAIILHKGHNKDRCLDSSYRTISSCPFLAKCIDVYLGDLSRDDWTACQAATQF